MPLLQLVRNNPTTPDISSDLIIVSNIQKYEYRSIISDIGSIPLFNLESD